MGRSSSATTCETGAQPLVLGFDTSAAYCAAALMCGDRIIAAKAEDMTRGQVERLMPLLQDVLADGQAQWADLMRIGVGIGPGNFTGIRIAVSAARGLALALGIPAVGVSTFDAISRGQTGLHMSVVPGPRDQVYLRAPGDAPRLATMCEAKDLGLPLVSVGSSADLAESIARIAAITPLAGLAAPTPLYVKSADAAPSRVTAPVMLDDDA